MSSNRSIYRNAKQSFHDSLTSESFNDHVITLPEITDLMHSAEMTELTVENIGLHPHLPLLHPILADLCSPSSASDADFIVTDEFMFEEDNIYSNIDNIEALPDDSVTADEEDNIHDAENFHLTLAEELLLFFVMFNISENAMKYLLKLLVKHKVNVPSSLYKLNKSKTNFTWQSLSVHNGQVGYLSIKENIIFCIEKGLLSLPDMSYVLQIPIKINIDGLPLFKSSNVGLWPILCVIANIATPLPLCLFCGLGKPDLVSFIGPLCDELKELCSVGFVYKHCQIVISSVLFICDAPARAYVQCIQGHNSKVGCGYCRICGIWHENRVVFPFCESTLRTDASYACLGENNQLSLSPLAEVVHLRTAFPPEYMHLVCLGIVRKLFAFYLTSPVKGRRLPCKLSQQQQISMSELMTATASSTPSEFQRRPRSLKEFEHFKATEFRLLILYFGPYFLKTFLPLNYYKHFLLLHYAIYVYASPRLHYLYSCAARCLEIFVQAMPKLFGTQSMSYNVHVLLHLHEYVEEYGPLDNFSAFPFENHLSILKKRIKKTRSIFQHSLTQLINIRSLLRETGPSVLSFSSNPPNNCAILADGTVVLVTQVSGAEVFGQKLVFSHALYSFPYSSLSLGFGFYKMSGEYLYRESPVSKAICIPSGSEFLVLPYA
jgi:hypothetical protein